MTGGRWALPWDDLRRSLRGFASPSGATPRQSPPPRHLQPSAPRALTSERSSVPFHRFLARSRPTVVRAEPHCFDERVISWRTPTVPPQGPSPAPSPTSRAGRQHGNPGLGTGPAGRTGGRLDRLGHRRGDARARGGVSRQEREYQHCCRRWPAFGTATISFGALGAAMGLGLGMAGGLIRRSIPRAVLAGATGLLLGAGAGVALSRLILPVYYEHAQGGDISYSLMVHAGIWAGVAAAAGLAFAIGLGGVARRRPRNAGSRRRPRSSRRSSTSSAAACSFQSR